MNGITLTSNAFSLTMIGVGYILDKATDGTTVMYSINPSQSTKLQRVSVSGNVPSFSGGMAAASVGNKIVTYSAASNNAVTFNSFDTVALDWSGPGLVNGSNSGSSSSSVPVGAIVGGVVGGLAVIALVAFLFIRHRRASKKISGTADVQPRGANEDPTTMSTATAPLMEQKTAIQQQQQQDIYSAQPLTTVPLQQQTQPKIFQPQTQESYNYVPPTLILESPPQPQPNIFRAQESSPYSDYSQAGYVSPTSGATPQTPSSQLYTPAYPSNTGANPQYIPPSNGDGYVE
ncbi:hypothetical protein EDD21DRAFT_221344 [Dissophora ornata]|nr:hypothetical protein EDD21DRAFT_221344 [Dissophora ornata]